MTRSRSGAVAWPASIEETPGLRALRKSLLRRKKAGIMTDDHREQKAYRAGFIAGVRCAASEAAQYPTTHPYRLDDCIEMKLNVTKRKRPRRRKTTKS